MKKRRMIEKLWREEKYKVMIHSQKHYNLIRESAEKYEVEYLRKSTVLHK